MGTALPGLSCPACLGWRGLGPSCQGPGSEGVAHSDGQCLGRGGPGVPLLPDRRAPRQSRRSGSVFPAGFGLVCLCQRVTCISPHVPSLPLAPAPGIGPWAQESSAFIPVLNSYRSHLETFFLPFLGCVFWTVFSSIQVISTFSMTCIEEAPFICINHI